MRAMCRYQNRAIRPPLCVQWSDSSSNAHWWNAFNSISHESIKLLILVETKQLTTSNRAMVCLHAVLKYFESRSNSFTGLFINEPDTELGSLAAQWYKQITAVDWSNSLFFRIHSHQLQGLFYWQTTAILLNCRRSSLCVWNTQKYY